MMNGIIIYADDDVLTRGSNENALFEKFLKFSDSCIIPITTLDNLDTILKSSSVIRALILDWQFKSPDPDIYESTPSLLKKILEEAKLYSLVYIYSRDDCSDSEDAKTLKGVYGERIHFSQKSLSFDVEEEFKKISKDLTDFEKLHKYMAPPLLWASCINQSSQTIFSELGSLNMDWIAEIYKTAKMDGGDPLIEIIGIFNNLLTEALLQNDNLRKELERFSNDASSPKQSDASSSEDSDASSSEEPNPQDRLLRLYQRIYYSRIQSSTPISTGDIFHFDGDEYGILVTPECDIRKRKEHSLEFLIFSSQDFEAHLRGYQLEGKKFKYIEAKKEKKENIGKKFNNNEMSVHILPAFPFQETPKVACIEFNNAFSIKKSEEFKEKRTLYKLNSPYIHQLRQRFIAFWGRYGVPALPESLREYCLSKITLPPKNGTCL